MKGLVKCWPNLIAEGNCFGALGNSNGGLKEVEGNPPTFCIWGVEKKFTLGLITQGQSKCLAENCRFANSVS